MKIMITAPINSIEDMGLKRASGVYKIKIGSDYYLPDCTLIVTREMASRLSVGGTVQIAVAVSDPGPSVAKRPSQNKPLKKG